MGYLLDGQWKEGWYDTASTGGEFVRLRHIECRQVLFGER